MQGLERIDQHAGDVAPPPQHAQRRFGHVGKRIGFVRRRRIADAGLHVAPPAVIGAAKAHQMRSAGMIARQPHRLHDGFGARHMKRYLVEPGNFLEEFDVLDDQRMVGAEHRAKLAHPRRAALDGFLVKIVTENVDAVGAAQIVAAIAVQIGDRHAARRLHEGGGRQVRAHHAAILERHPIGIGELQIGNGLARFGGAPDGFGKARLIKRRQPGEAGAASCDDVRRRVVGREEASLVVVVERHQAGEPACDPGVPGERPVLGLRQFKPLPQGRKRGRNRRGAKPVEGEMAVHRIAV